eukprot:2380135-Heterocapsa_arctica.AAC.1
MDRIYNRDTGISHQQDAMPQTLELDTPTRRQLATRRRKRFVAQPQCELRQARGACAWVAGRLPFTVSQRSVLARKAAQHSGNSSGAKVSGC